MSKKNIHEIEIKIENEEWEKALEKAFQKKSKTTKIDGFRPGKVTREIYEKKFGIESLYMDAVDEAMALAYERAIKEKGLMPIIQPEVNIKNVDKNHVEFSFKVTTKPEVKISSYKNLGVEKPSVKVTKKEIEEEIEKIQKKYAELLVKDGKIENGDVAIIDFEGFNDGVAFEGGKGTNYSLEIGSNSFIPGFEEKLIGKTKDDEFEFPIKFPDSYPKEDLKGKEVTFKVKVNEVKEKKIPELSKELYEDLGLADVNTLEDFENTIKENIEARKTTEGENEFVDKLLKACSKNAEVEIPEALVEEEIKRMMSQYEEQLKMQGLDLEKFYEITKSTEDQMKEQMKEEASNRVLYRFVLEEVANLENIEISDSDAEKEANVLAEKYNVEKEEFLSMFGGIQMIKYDMKMRKAIEVLKNNN